MPKTKKNRCQLSSAFLQQAHKQAVSTYSVRVSRDGLLTGVLDCIANRDNWSAITKLAAHSHMLSTVEKQEILVLFDAKNNVEGFGAYLKVREKLLDALNYSKASSQKSLSC